MGGQVIGLLLAALCVIAFITGHAVWGGIILGVLIVAGIAAEVS